MENNTERRGFLLSSIVIGVCVVGGCLFPILNLNASSPVDLSIPVRIIVLVTAIGAFRESGKAEAVLYPRQPVAKIAIANAMLALVGLGLRYLLEFGEVSNAYNFTAENVALHLVFAVVGTTAAYLQQQKKSSD